MQSSSLFVSGIVHLTGLKILFSEPRRHHTTVGSLVKRTVESRNEEDEDLGAHTDEEHDIGTREMGQLKQRSKDDDGRTPTVSIIEECLACHGIHPFLQAVDEIIFTVCCHNRLSFLLFTCRAVGQRPDASEADIASGLVLIFP